MAELKASEIKYGVPLVTKLGGVLFTATVIETPASAEYSDPADTGGGILLNLAKLGLADEAVLGVAQVAGPEGGTGETATTTSLPAAAWSSPLMTAKTSSENERVLVAYQTAVTLGKGKLYLRIFAQNVAGEKEPLLEPKAAIKAPISLCSCTIYCFGK